MASGTGEKWAYLRHGWAHTAHVTATTWMVTAVGGWSVRARECVHACVYYISYKSHTLMISPQRMRAYMRAFPSTDFPSTDACVHACVRACVRACVCDVFAIYYNIIWHRLIMIIIKTIILYFIQITHTDDFPSTDTRLVVIKCPFYDGPDMRITARLSATRNVLYLITMMNLRNRPWIMALNNAHFPRCLA